MAIFDSHFHIIDPRFPLQENQGFCPEPFPISAYKDWVKKLGVEGGAVVSGSFQGCDTTYLTSALADLGPEFVGVAQLNPSITDEELQNLHKQGVRAICFNIKRCGMEVLSHLESFGKRVYDQNGWHVELYIDAKDLPEIKPTILRLPKVSIDHLGLSEEGLPLLLDLVSKGVKVKATGFGRLNFDPLPALRQIFCENESALMFGTDLPSTRAKRPFYQDDIELITQNFSKTEAQKILFENGSSFYRNDS